MLLCFFVAEAAVEYETRIEGLSGRALKKEVEGLLGSFRLEDRAPSTIGQLYRRVEGDVPKFEQILESQGYYDAAVDAVVDETQTPHVVTFHVEQGEAYRFGEVAVELITESADVPEPITDRIRRGRQVTTKQIFREQTRILDLLKRRGYPFPTLASRRVMVDRVVRRVDVVLTFRTGARSFFGEVEIQEVDFLKESFFIRQLPWRAGDLYDAKELSDFENRLLGSGLFSAVRVDVEQQEGNILPVIIRASERDPRTVRLGVNYADIGLGGKILWEHRNLTGNGERLTASVSGSEIEVGANISLLRPGFLRAHQALQLELDVSDEYPDAYDSRKARVSAMVLRDLTPKIEVGVGTGYQYSRVEQLLSDENYGLLFFPLQLQADFRNDRLNPVRGGHLFGRTSYYHDTLSSDSFLKSALEGRHYLMWWDRYRLSSALRVTLGSIDGASVESVPADERFYAGGGGSIRGYEYQAVGPEFDGTPLGGDKLLEFSAELRLQPGRKLGYALFADGGTVYNGLVSDSDRSLRYGAGAGIRWFTAIGPLRVDAAYPINPSSNQSERLQFYISLGQAF